MSNAMLNVFGNRFLSDLVQHGTVIDRYSRRTGSALAKAVAGHNMVFASTGGDNCLDIDPSLKQITVNRDFFDTIARRALDANMSMVLSGDTLVRRTIRRSARSAVRMIVGHEMFHPEQGMRTIADLRAAALAVGWNDVSKLDADADFRAAAVEASLSAIEDGCCCYEEVLRRFEDALAFQLRYCVPVFGCPENKPHKRSRVAGLVMQLAKIVVANRLGASVDDVAFGELTMPVFVQFDNKYSRLGIVGLDPLMFLGSVQFEQGELKEFFDGLDSGNVEWLVKQAIVLNMRIGRISA